MYVAPQGLVGMQVCPREVWLHVQTVSCDDERLDLGPRAVRMKADVCVPESGHGPTIRLRLYGVGILWTASRLFVYPTANEVQVSQACQDRVW